MNRTLPDADAVCVSGAVALRSGSATVTIDPTPVYFPPRIGGKTQLVTRQVDIAPESRTPIPLGSVLFVLDDSTSYLVFGEDAAPFFELIPKQQNTFSLDPNDIRNAAKLASTIPGSASTAIFVTTSTSGVDLLNAKLGEISPSIRVLGVSIKKTTKVGGDATFYERVSEASTFKKVGNPLHYESELLGLGAIVAAERCRASWAQDAFIRRTRIITQVYENRSASLALSLDLDDTCKQHFTEAVATLKPVNSLPSDAQYFLKLFAAEDVLLYLQGTLGAKACPGVA